MATSYLGLEFNFTLQSMPVEWHCVLRPVFGLAWSQALSIEVLESTQASVKGHDVNLTAIKGGAVPSGFAQSAGQIELALMQCCSGLGKQPAPGHNHFTPLRRWEKLWPVIGSMPMVVIAPSTEGGVVRISSKLHNS